MGSDIFLSRVGLALLGNCGPGKSGSEPLCPGVKYEVAYAGFGFCFAPWSRSPSPVVHEVLLSVVTEKT